ncbi:hypothetical protein N9137_03180 [Pseudomonadales bacterium]|nr:hypothetical protein [Pseudomonadales bacterium]
MDNSEKTKMSVGDEAWIMIDDRAHKCTILAISKHLSYYVLSDSGTLTVDYDKLYPQESTAYHCTVSAIIEEAIAIEETAQSAMRSFYYDRDKLSSRISAMTKILEELEQ